MMPRYPIQIGRIGSANRGYRIIAVRKPPKKSWMGRWIDAWIPQLSPSQTVWKNYTSGKIDWEDFKARYIYQLHAMAPQNILKSLALLSFRRTVVLLCDCLDLTHCPETLLAVELNLCRAKGDFVLKH